MRRRVNVALSLGAVAVCLGALVVAASHSAASYARDYPEPAASKVAAVAAADPRAEVFANEAFADWLLWKVPSLAGRVAFDARFELLTAQQLHAVAHFREQSSPDWQAPATGYRVLVLDPAQEGGAVRAYLDEAGTRKLYLDSHIAVLLRPRQQ